MTSSAIKTIKIKFDDGTLKLYAMKSEEDYRALVMILNVEYLVDDNGIGILSFELFSDGGTYRKDVINDGPKSKKRRKVNLQSLEGQEWMNLLEIPHSEPTSPPFVSQDGWLDDIVGRVADLCLKEDAANGLYRVPITSLACCSRGGKTRALLELAKA
mmetsp:Transcript_25684/g.60794  ORF Transcript_25684/g.60794 Transcript_25684/m.60794 type:complete len:158 (+) Transcript_25684:124-597(+)